jgi:hypothetical protein
VSTADSLFDNMNAVAGKLLVAAGLLGVVSGLGLPAAHVQSIDPCAAPPPPRPPSCTAPTVAGYTPAGDGWFAGTCQMCDASCPVPLKTGQSDGCKGHGMSAEACAVACSASAECEAFHLYVSQFYFIFIEEVPSESINQHQSGDCTSIRRPSGDCTSTPRPSPELTSFER